MVKANVPDRNPYPQRRDVQEYAEPPKAVWDDLTLGPNFDISALRAPHSYDGPYGSLNTGSDQRPNRPAPSQLDPRRPPQVQRNGSRNGPQYDLPPRQQAPPQQRPRYMDDYDYSRPNPPPPQRMMPPQEQYASNRPHGNESLNSPLFNRSRAPAPAPEQYREQRRSPERQYPDPRPEPQYQNYGGMGSRGRSEERYDRDYDPPMRRVSPTRSEPRGPPPSMRSNNDQQSDSNSDQMEIWRQIRSTAQHEKNRSTSSSRSSTDSGETRSRRSENTPPSSAASPISPSKQSDYPHASSPLKITTTGLEHNRKGSDVSPTKLTLPVCRACDETIRGRSLASQDGKLSGRYHKRCFCCTTCQKPFETASFYVFQDRPYCKQHYHELNHSMCAQCGEGVEGQCLQLEDATIRHPDCFTCHVYSPISVTILTLQTCHIQLDEDYYESNGLPYCDRHARLQGRKDQRMERRKTRLLMM